MGNIFEENKFLGRKWLLSFIDGEERLLPVSKCSYPNIKSTASQLKKMGLGEWKISKKGGIGDAFTRVIRIK